MGTINPETLYNKVYTDSPFKKGTVFIDEVAAKDFREFLQRTKPNFGDSTDNALLESLSELVHTKSELGVDSCKKVCNDIQENLCSSMCNKIRCPCSVSSRVVFGGIFISLTAALIYKMRAINQSTSQHDNDSVDEDSNSQQNVSSDEDVVDAPRIVNINTGWFF